MTRWNFVKRWQCLTRNSRKLEMLIWTKRKMRDTFLLQRSWFDSHEQGNHRERNQESNLYHFFGRWGEGGGKEEQKFETNARRANPRSWYQTGNIENKRDTEKKKRVKISNFKMRPILCWDVCSVAILPSPEYNTRRRLSIHQIRLLV